MDTLFLALLKGTIYGLLLFLVFAGLTHSFRMMGVLKFAHASLYMLGAYFGYTLQYVLGFWGAVAVAPLLVRLVRAARTRARYRAQRSATSAGNGPRHARSRPVHRVGLINMAMNPDLAGMLA